LDCIVHYIISREATVREGGREGGRREGGREGGKEGGREGKKGGKEGLSASSHYFLHIHILVIRLLTPCDGTSGTCPSSFPPSLAPSLPHHRVQLAEPGKLTPISSYFSPLALFPLHPLTSPSLPPSLPPSLRWHQKILLREEIHCPLTLGLGSHDRLLPGAAIKKYLGENKREGGTEGVREGGREGGRGVSGRLVCRWSSSWTPQRR